MDIFGRFGTSHPSLWSLFRLAQMLCYWYNESETKSKVTLPVEALKST